MRLKILAASAAVLPLIAVPAVANPAASLSLSNSAPVRAASATTKKSHAAAGVGVILALVVGAGAVAGALLVGDDSRESPDSN